MIAVGGLCGYGIEQTVDTVGAMRQVFPVIGSPNATSLYYAAASTPVLGDGDASTSGYQNISAQIASLIRHGNVVTATLAGNPPVDVNGLTMTVSGVADASYNGSFQVTSIGGNHADLQQYRTGQHQHGRNSLAADWRVCALSDG